MHLGDALLPCRPFRRGSCGAGGSQRPARSASCFRPSPAAQTLRPPSTSAHSLEADRPRGSRAGSRRKRRPNILGAGACRRSLFALPSILPRACGASLGLLLHPEISARRSAPSAVEFVHEFDDTRQEALPPAGLDALPLYAMAAYLEIPVLMVRRWKIATESSVSASPCCVSQVLPVVAAPSCAKGLTLSYVVLQDACLPRLNLRHDDATLNTVCDILLGEGPRHDSSHMALAVPFVAARLLERAAGAAR